MKHLSLQRVADRHYVKTKVGIISKCDFYYALDFLMWHHKLSYDNNDPIVQLFPDSMQYLLRG